MNELEVYFFAGLVAGVAAGVVLTFFLVALIWSLRETDELTEDEYMGRE